MTITSLQLTVIMAAYTGRREDDHFIPNTETYRNQTDALIDAGIIKITGNINKYKWSLTHKGEFWYKYILSTPFPVEKVVYEIPKGIENV